MANKRFDATYESGRDKINVEAEVFSWVEDNIFYYFCPALDIIGYGISDQEAQRSFEDVLKAFIEYTHNKRTLFDELERLGWTTNKKKKRAHPPTKEQLLDDNEEFRHILQRDDVKSHQRNLEFA